MTGDPTLVAVGLRVDALLHGTAVPIVDGIDLTIAPGEIVGLVGESGSGKSLTCLGVLGLLPDGLRREARDLRLGDLDLLPLRGRALADVRGGTLAMVFQEPMSSLNPAYTVGRQVADVHRRHTGSNRRDAMARVVDMFREVGLPDPERNVHQYPHELSGGMRQRVMLAMAMICEPSVLLADEPTTALDVTVQAQVLAVLEAMVRRRGTSVLLVSHDLGVIAMVCDRIMVMYAGSIVEEGDMATVYAQPRHPYTAALLEASLGSSSRSGPLTTIEGSVPLPGEVTAGCRFRFRCPHAVERCAGPIETLTIGPGHTTACIRARELWAVDA